MKYEDIHELLNRYWEGETTLEEERSIKAYFSSEAIDSRLQSFAPMFQALREERALQLATQAKSAPMRSQVYLWAAAASAALLLSAGWWMCNQYNIKAPAAIQAIAEQPKTMGKQGAQPLQNAQVQEERISPITALPKKIKTPKHSKPEPGIDPETAQAMAEIKAALALVSSKLDRGRNEAVKGASHLDAMNKVPKRDEG